MTETTYLTLDDALLLHEGIMSLTGCAPAPLKAGGDQLLGSALARPQWAAHYEGADLIRQAAVLDGVIRVCTEARDLPIVRRALLDDPRPGDVIVTPATGAYGFSMANNYNGVPRAPVIFCKDGDARVVVRRESFEDLTSRDFP